MSAADRLEAALLNAAEALMEVVGLAANPADPNGERIPVSGSIVSRDEVPQSPWLAAVYALDVLSVGYGLMDPEAEPVATLDEELAAITEGRGA